MKKLLFLISALLFQPLHLFAQGTPADETTASLYEKINAKTYFGKVKNAVIDKEIKSDEFPDGMKIISRTYFAQDKAREEAFISNPFGIRLNITAIFTRENTFVSYDGGTIFSPLNETLIETINSHIKKPDFFSPKKSKISKSFYDLNGKQCYVVGENEKLTFIEKNSYLVLRLVIPSGKDERTIADMSDYKKIKDDFYVPFKIRIAVENLLTKTAKISEITITALKIDVNFDDSLFVPKNISQTAAENPIFDIKSLLKSII
ncbi:MAG: hypothetical protein LBU09_05845 [Endomicrobium sp.]|jgi:hypothetical protein|nr:hypothetical protein [Endomicrobium sp.]